LGRSYASVAGYGFSVLRKRGEVQEAIIECSATSKDTEQGDGRIVSILAKIRGTGDRETQEKEEKGPYSAL
jgi:hypothetical protein